MLAAALRVLRGPGRNLDPVGGGAVIPRQKAVQNPGLPLYAAAVPPPAPYLQAQGSLLAKAEGCSTAAPELCLQGPQATPGSLRVLWCVTDALLTGLAH